MTARWQPPAEIRRKIKAQAMVFYLARALLTRLCDMADDAIAFQGHSQTSLCRPANSPAHLSTMRRR
jgi:hypothetical protein